MAATGSSPNRLEVGDPAPPFTLSDQHDAERTLAEFSGRKLLVYFYPKADTPGCTAQSCGLRDIASDVGDTAIIGISPDLPPKLRRFDEKFSLGFPLLSDPDHAVAEAWGVWGEKKLYGRAHLGIIRSAFLVGEDATLREVWYKVSPKDTPKNLLRSLAL